MARHTALPLRLICRFPVNIGGEFDSSSVGPVPEIPPRPDETARIICLPPEWLTGERSSLVVSDAAFRIAGSGLIAWLRELHCDGGSLELQFV